MEYYHHLDGSPERGFELRILLRQELRFPERCLQVEWQHCEKLKYAALVSVRGAFSRPRIVSFRAKQAYTKSTLDT